MWITEYPNPREIEEAVITSFELAKSQDAEGLNRDDLDEVRVSSIAVVDFWANGRGGENIPLDLVIFVEPSILRMSQVTNAIEEFMDIRPVGNMEDFFPGANFTIVESDNKDDVLENKMFGSEGEDKYAYDLTERTYLALEQNPPFGFDIVELEPPQAQTETQQQEPEETDTTSGDEGETPEPVDSDQPTLLDTGKGDVLPPQFRASLGQEAEEEPPEEDTGPKEVELLAERFPDIPAPLRPYGIDEGRVRIPASVDTKEVDARELYDFEKEMMTQGEADTPIGKITDGVGEAAASGQLGGKKPAGTFPRTGVYIKNHLKHEGPSYPLEIYNDIVVYSGYISQMYNGLYKPGSYDSMRVMVHRLSSTEIEVSGGTFETPTIAIPEEAAKEQELQLAPNHPETGEQMPWLENRQYYILNQNLEDHPSWNNITDWEGESE